jgi:hypothetical protein
MIVTIAIASVRIIREIYVSKTTKKNKGLRLGICWDASCGLISGSGTVEHCAAC